MEIAQVLFAVTPPTPAAQTGPLAGSSDASIIRAARKGDGRAEEELVRRYWDEAARSALLIIGDEYLAEDVAQEALISALSSLRKFDPSRPFGPWLHRIAINKAIDRARKVAIDPAVMADDEIAVRAGTISSDEPDDRGAEVLEALSDFEPEDKAMLVARHVLGYQAAEIGEWFGMPAATVRVRIHRAGIRLRLLLGEGDQDGSND